MRLSRTVSLLKMWQSWSFWHKSIFSPDEGDHWLTSSLAVHDTLMMYVVESKFAGRCDRQSFSRYATQIIITVLTIFSNLHFLADAPSFSPSQLDKNDHWHTLHDNAWWNNIWKIDRIKIRFAGRCQHHHSQVTFSLVVAHTNFQHHFTYLGIGKITFLQLIITHANVIDSCNSYHH